MMCETKLQTTTVILGDSAGADAAAYEKAGQILRSGGLVAFPTETVYGLGGNALDPEAARKIYAAKGRPSDNPLILHIADRKDLAPLVKKVPETAEILMDAFWPGPMTLIFEKSGIVPAETTGGLSTAAIRMPSHPAAAAMIRAAGVPVAAPSANSSGRPSPTTAAHVAEDLEGKIDMILDGGPVDIGLESTILDVTGEIPVILRPGYISREDVIRLVGACEVDPAILKKPDPGLRPKAPGMKYRHYAPKADLTIVEAAPEGTGSREEAAPDGGGDQNAPAACGRGAAEICRLAAAACAEGKKTGILCAEESRDCYPAELVKSIGSRRSQESIAHNLYRCLREFDEEGTEVVYSESFREGELGAAIMNRLTKAAGYRIKRV